jgi:hypothetical protein
MGPGSTFHPSEKPGKTNFFHKGNFSVEKLKKRKRKRLNAFGATIN